MIAVFAKHWLDIADQKISEVWSIDVHDQDFKSCSGDEASLCFSPPDEFLGLFGYSRDRRGVEFCAMNISVMDPQDPQDKAPMAGPAPTWAFGVTLTYRPRQSAGIPQKLRRRRVLKDMTCARYGAKSV